MNFFEQEKKEAYKSSNQSKQGDYIIREATAANLPLFWRCVLWCQRHRQLIKVVVRLVRLMYVFCPSSELDDICNRIELLIEALDQ